MIMKVLFAMSEREQSSVNNVVARYYEKYGETVEASDKTIDSYDVSGNLRENEVIE